ncbi:co-chaperone GroES [Myxococcota bacterium]|jgi:chaperonin GroES|nr:co-chaperone GroES [Myxococcota bacterium]MBU1411921.1 co-chaperone GroES [Myxococcota bacterium]MBU1509607.1 co-chaperone GroES [Myxococcota bacterium]PKN23750.1 MAG: co-chaperone GroES [Deltaproteobacteria bacterium HGW-Deltaproteobacteria-22]PKN48048.1 MAG: co-chaperone GroES [Deltaproteobacteria bacterium HGW-Deltaproteobacteria-17]
MKITPLNETVLLRPVRQEPPAGGLLLPESMLELPDTGEVVAISPLLTDLDLAPGDRVIYKKYAGTEIEWNQEKLRFVAVGDLQAKWVQADAIPEA